MDLVPRTVKFERQMGQLMEARSETAGKFSVSCWQIVRKLPTRRFGVSVRDLWVRTVSFQSVFCFANHHGDVPDGSEIRQFFHAKTRWRSG